MLGTRGRLALGVLCGGHSSLLLETVHLLLLPLLPRSEEVASMLLLVSAKHYYCNFRSLTIVGRAQSQHCAVQVVTINFKELAA